MIKKILSAILLLVFFTSSYNISFASNYSNDITSEINLSKSKIKKFKNWNKYIIQLKKVDNYINNINDIKLLTKIKSRVDTKKEKTIPSMLWWNSSNDLTYELLNYISLIIEQKISKINENDIEKTINYLKNPELSVDEVKSVENEIVKLQLNLLDSSKILLDKLVSDLQKSLNVEEKWNLKLNIEWSWALFWNAKWELNITDYKSKTSNFDSEFKSQVDLLIEASIKWMPELKTQFSSFIDFITKDGNYYLLMNKLEYSWIDNNEINWYLEKLKKLASNNEYLKIEDKENAKYINLIKNFDLNWIYKETNKILLNPMFKPYKKVWDKYLILPTKEACNTIKWIEYKINKRWSWSCSDNEYNNLLKEILKNWNIYIIIDWNDKHFWYDVSNNQEKWFIKIYFSDKKIEKILAKFEPTLSKYAWDFAEFIFINWQKLDLVFNIKSENIFVSFKSILSSVNKFNKIDYVWNVKDDFKSNFNLENKKFNWKFITILKNYNYDYNTWKSSYEKSWELTWNISWVLDTNNKINFFDIVINWNQSKNKYNYDWESWKSTSSKVDSIFKLNYVLNNELISWYVNYTEDNNELFSIKSTWKYKKEYFELNNSINIKNINSTNETINWNLNTKFVWNLNKNDFNIYFDIYYPSYGFIKFDLKSDYERTQRNNLKIEAPKNYKNLDEVFPNNSKTNNNFFQ